MRSGIFLALIATLFIAQLVSAQYRSYAGYKLVGLTFDNEPTMKHFVQLVDERFMDVWSNDGTLVYGSKNVNQVLLHQRQIELIFTYLKLPVNLLVAPREMVSAITTTMHFINEDIEGLLIAEREIMFNSKPNDDFYSKYRSFEEISQLVKDLAAKYSDIASVFNPITTWENRTVLGLKITATKNESKPILVFNGLQHAREWISGMVNSYAMQTLLEKYAAGDERIVSLLKKIDIYITPCVNADGYAYTFTKDRLWRKNRRNNGDGTFGVDLNRNYVVGWGIGASTNPSSIVYQGKKPLSEPESSQYVSFLSNLRHRIKAGIDFHSYSQLVLRSWGFNNSQTPTEADQKLIGANMAQAIYDTHQQKYQNLRGVELYPAGGGLDDHMFGELGFYSYTIELRDTGKYGFVLPVNQIIPTCEENFNAILTLAEQHVAKYA